MKKINFILPVLISTTLLLGCAASVSNQVNSLSTRKSCCTTVGKIESSGSLTADLELSFNESTPVFVFKSGLSPFIALTLSEGSTGKNLEIRATPEMMARTPVNSLIFTPIDAIFLDSNGIEVVSDQNSGISATSGGLAYLFTITRKIKIPKGARRVILHSDASLFGTKQTFGYSTAGYLMPVGSIFIPTGGGSQVTAIYSVNGNFKVRLE